MDDRKSREAFLIVARLCIALLFILGALLRSDILPEERDEIVLLAIIAIPVLIWVLYSDGKRVLKVLKETGRSFRQASRVDVTPSIFIDPDATRHLVQGVDLSKPDPRPLRDRIATWIGMTLLLSIGALLLGVLFYFAIFSHA